VQTAAAIVQAAAVVVIVILTRLLAKANDALVMATHNSANSARDQVDELVAAQHAAVRPYLHVTWARSSSDRRPNYVGTVAKHGLTNVGPGPAFQRTGTCAPPMPQDGDPTVLRENPR
jgi:hypothetical protein